MYRYFIKIITPLTQPYILSMPHNCTMTMYFLSNVE